MAEQLREQQAFSYTQNGTPIPPRRSASPDDLEARRTHTGTPPTTRSRQTADDDGYSSFPMQPMVRRFDRMPLTTQREYMIPLNDGTAIYVTERKLATMGRDYKEAAQEVTPGTIAQKQKQKQKRQPQGNTNKATPPDVIEVPPRQTQAQPASYYPTIGQRVRGWTGRRLVVLGIGLMIMIVGYILLNILGNWWTTTQNDWHYGRPRTFQVDANVGHGTAANPYSHFIAINLNKHIEVIEIPGNDPAKSLTYIGPTLIGPGEELTPVTLSFEDVNGDGHPDLVIHVADSKFIFLNQKVNGVWKFVPAPNQ